MASTFLTAEEPYLMDSSAAVPLDFSADLPVSNSWRYDSWGAQVGADNFGVDMEATFDPLVSPQQDSDESVTDLDEIPSPMPSSPSSDEVANFEFAQDNQDMPIMDQSPDMLLPEFYNDEEDDESTDSTTDSFDTADPSSVASPSSPIHNHTSASTNASTPASTGKRRGRPRTNKPNAASAAASASAPSTGGGRKRKADSINSESLLGTKKAKTGSTTSALVDRLPSSISAVELQGMSSAEYDSYFGAVSSKLSRHEIELAKLQRRRIKNRESASNSRVRKQDNLSDLETQVQQLREQNEVLRQKAMSFQSEQKAMSRELDTYKRLVREHLPAEFVPSFFAQSNSGSPSSSNSTEVIHVSTRTGQRSTRTLARDVSSAALMCLVLFAMIWGTTTVVPGSVLRDAQLPFGGPSRFTFPVALNNGASPSSHIDSASSAMAPVSSSSSSALITSSRRSTTAAAQAAAAAAQAAAAAANAHSRTPVQGDGDWLAQVISRNSAHASALPNTNVMNTKKQTVDTSSATTMMNALPTASRDENKLASLLSKKSTNSNEMAVDGVLDTLQATHSTRTEAALLSTKEPSSNNDTIISARLSQDSAMATSSSSASTTSASSSTEATQTTYSPEWKQNTTYIMCDNMQQVIPPTGSQPAVDPSSPLYVSLWVNPSALSASPIPSASKDPFNMDYLVQITCQIMSVDQLGLLSPSSSLPSGPSLSLPSVLAESSS